LVQYQEYQFSLANNVNPSTKYFTVRSGGSLVGLNLTIKEDNSVPVFARITLTRVTGDSSGLARQFLVAQGYIQAVNTYQLPLSRFFQEGFPLESDFPVQVKVMIYNYSNATYNFVLTVVLK